MVKKPTVFETREITLGAALVLHGFPVQDIRTAGSVAYLVFELDAKVSALSKNFFLKRLKVEPVLYLDTIRHLRVAVRSAVDNDQNGNGSSHDGRRT